MVKPLHADLENIALLPTEHLMDAGFVRSEQLVDSPQQYGVTLIGPTARDSSWQAHTPGAFDKSHFQVDWERQVVTCPMGKQSHLWLTDQQGIARQVQVFFNRDDCLACSARAQCTRSKKGARILSLQPRPYHEALQDLRQYQRTQDFKQRYATRSGVECLFSQGSRRCDVQQARYRGQRKTHVQQLRSRDSDQSLTLGRMEAGATNCANSSRPFRRPLGCLTLPTVSSMSQFMQQSTSGQVRAPVLKSLTPLVEGAPLAHWQRRWEGFRETGFGPPPAPSPRRTASAAPPGFCCSPTTLPIPRPA